MSDKTSAPISGGEGPVRGPRGGYYVALAPVFHSEDERALTDYLRVLIEFRWTVVVIVLVFAIGGLVVAFAATPVFRSDVVMAPAQTQDGDNSLSQLASQYGGLAAAAGIQLSPKRSDKVEAIATLESRAFTEAFIKDNNLMPVLFRSRWNAAAGKWQPGRFGRVPTIGDGVRLFSRKVRTVSEDPQTGLVTLSIQWTNRRQAAQWANELVRRLNLHMRQQAVSEASKSIAYLRRQLKSTSIVELQQGIYRLIEEQTRKIMLANVRKQYSFRVIDPAVVSDKDAYVKPRRALWIAGSCGAGVVMALLLVMLIDGVRRRNLVDGGRDG